MLRGKGRTYMIWFWLFWFYSFLGYLLERMFAKVVRSEQQVRKCFLLLPLCPVYGLGMTVFLSLTRVEEYGFLSLALRGAVLTTLVEYAVHVFYEAAFGVRFWDYGDLPGSVWGRVCLPFSAVWGLLSAVSARYLQPTLLSLAAGIPPLLTYAALLVLTADAVCSAALLRQYRDTELLSIRALMGFFD